MRVPLAAAAAIADVVVLSMLIQYDFIIKSQFRNLFPWYSSILLRATAVFYPVILCCFCLLFHMAVCDFR